MKTEERSEEGRITPEALEAARRRIGIETPQQRPGHEYASVDGIRHYAEGLGDKNPLYRFEEYGKKTRWGSIVAHPTMMLHMGVSTKKELTKEERERGEGGGLAGVHAFYSGEDMEWFQPIYAGDRLTVRGGLAKVEEKVSTFSGRTVHLTRERVFRNQRGELVGITRHLGILSPYSALLPHR